MIGNEVIIGIGLIILLIVIFKDKLKTLSLKKGLVQVTEKDAVKHSIDVIDYDGEGGYSYRNLTYAKAPTINPHTGRATLYLKGLQFPLTNVCLNQHSGERDIIWETNMFGTQRVGRCRVDGNNVRHEWSNKSAAPQETYIDNAMNKAEKRVKTKMLEDKALSEEMAGIKFVSDENKKKKKESEDE
jgi:hypothetical protein